MKLRHLIAIFSFLAAFGLSVFFVRLFLTEVGTFISCPMQDESVSVRPENELKVRIRHFLEADRQTGIELAKDKVRLSNSNYQRKAEKIATNNLVEKMKKIKCDGLPEDFCNAWDAHVVAWKYKTYLLDRDWKNGPLDYQISNEQISWSYQKMLTAARKYEVDFKY